jgi:hypothetical protein
LDRLIKIASLYQTYQAQTIRLTRQHGWLIDLQRLLDPIQPGSQRRLSSQEVEAQVNRYLVDLPQQPDVDQQDQPIMTHIITTFSQRWWGLFQCYDLPGLPPTNNALESFFGQLKTSQRRITGRKSVNRFVLRYGAYAAFVDRSETKADLLARLQNVDHTAYQSHHHQLQQILLQQRDYHRFCHRLDQVVLDLEAAWSAAVATVSQLSASPPSSP